MGNRWCKTSSPPEEGIQMDAMVSRMTKLFLKSTTMTLYIWSAPRARRRARVCARACASSRAPFASVRELARTVRECARVCARVRAQFKVLYCQSIRDMKCQGLGMMAKEKYIDQDSISNFNTSSKIKILP